MRLLLTAHDKMRGIDLGIIEKKRVELTFKFKGLLVLMVILIWQY